MGCMAVTPSCRRQCSEHGGGGETEKAECSAALRGSRGKYKLASLAYFAQFFLLCSSPLLHSVVGAATAKAWEHRKSKPEASMGIVGFP